MAFITQVGTTTTANTNLNTATLVHTQTNTTRIRKLWVNIFADQVKGTGDYIAHITIQRAGAGSFYESIKTTKTAAAGVTSVYFGSIPITLNATDVMKVYLIGLATDNDGTADVIVDVNEEWENIDANGRVDVGAWLGQAVQAAVNGIPKVDLTYILGTLLTETLAGYLAAGFKKLHDIAAPVFTLASVNQSADNNTKLADIQNRLPAALVGGKMDSHVNDIAAGAITAAAVATGAVDADALATDAVNEIVDQVWDEVMAGHLAGGSTGAKLNAAGGAITFPAGAVNYTYTVMDSVSGLPIEGVEVWFSTDLAGANVTWKGDTDAFGVARDVNGNLPALDAGTYFAWRQKAGYVFSDPDTEVVS